MTKKYQVYGCVAPSGGIFAASEQIFDTKKEATAEALLILGEVDAWTHYVIDGKQCTYPSYWAQKVETNKGVTYIVFE